MTLGVIESAWVRPAPRLVPISIASVLLLVAALIASYDFPLVGTTATPLTHPAPATGDVPRLSDLPLDFVENRGQWEAPAAFVAGKGATAAYFEQHAIRLRLGDAESTSVSLTFESASQGAAVVGEGKRAGYYNFVFGNDPARWQTGVAAYGSVLYRGLYEGVDLRVLEAGEQLQYDLLLAPGSDLGQVVVRVDGGSGLALADDGSLLLDTPAGPLRQTPPKTWETLPNGETRSIDSRFRIIDGQRYGFEAPEHDLSLGLVVDPGVDWATFLGGAGDDTFAGLALTSDGTGDIIIGGQTRSPDFPYTRGNLQAFDYGTFASAAWTPYVARLNSTGTALVYATLFGGTGNHSVKDVAVDASGQPALVGDTNSLDFPTTPGAHDTTPGNGNGDYDGYVIKFDASGSGVVFGTYLAGTPGTAGEMVWFVDHEPSGSVVVSGTAGTSGFPITAGAYPGQPGLFVSRLSPTGALTYSAFLGPASVYAMDVDPQGYVMLTGQTASATFPTTADAYDPSFNGSLDFFNPDAVVARMKLDGAGTADLKYSTYLGGAQYVESANAVAVDPNDPELVTVAGFTRSSDFPTTPGAYQRVHPIPKDGSVAFITRFRFPAAGPNALLWSTMYGAPGNQNATDVVIDSTGAAIIVGSTAVNNPPTTERAYDRIPNKTVGYGTYDAFAARISADGSQLLYASLLGGANGDVILDTEYAGGTSIIAGGVTNSPDFPVSATAFDPVYAHDGKQSGGATPGTLAYDVFVARFTLEPNATTDVTPPPAPELRWPPDGTTYTVPVLSVPFDWTDVSDPSGIQAYHLQVSPNPTFTNDLAAELRGWFEPWLPASLVVKGFGVSENATWYWRVQVLDGAGNLGPWSAVRSINAVDPPLSPPPTLLSPPNGGKFAPGDVTFAWGSVSGAKYYHLQVDTKSDFSSGKSIYVAYITQPQHTLNLTAQGRYWWRVRLAGDYSYGPWSTVRSFELKSGSPPAPPPPATPTPTAAPSTGTGVASLTPAEQWVGASGGQLTVTLNGPAPPGGAAVSLAAVYPDRIAVPPSVTVPEGSTSATATVTAKPTQINRGGSGVVAAYGGTMTAARVYVFSDDPVVELNGISPTATTIAGGESVQVTVSLLYTLTSGPNGALVTLGSSNPALASVPATVTIPPGGQSATFTVTTQPVSTVTNVFILAARSFTLATKITLGPPGTLATLGISPKTVVGGEPSQGTVTVAGAAPAGGVVVSLSSLDTTVATVPASVTVPAGATSATFPITTKVVCCQGHWSQITASAGGITKFETINVNPPSPWQMSSLSLSPTTVTGGTSSQGTVTLSGAAPNWGAVVQLSSSNTAVATVPASVTVAAGAIKASFTVSTTAVSASASVVITAYDGVTRTATLAVNPSGATATPTRTATPTPTPTPAGAATATPTRTPTPPPAGTATPVPTPTPTPAAAADTVSIQQAEYDSAGRRLRVEATSTKSTGTLTVHVTSTGALIGTLGNDGGGRYRGEFSWSTNPQSITVKSSLGGSATKTVTLK